MVDPKIKKCLLMNDVSLYCDSFVITYPFAQYFSYEATMSCSESGTVAPVTVDKERDIKATLWDAVAFDTYGYPNLCKLSRTLHRYIGFS